MLLFFSRAWEIKTCRTKERSSALFWCWRMPCRALWVFFRCAQSLKVAMQSGHAPHAFFCVVVASLSVRRRLGQRLTVATTLELRLMPKGQPSPPTPMPAILTVTPPGGEVVTLLVPIMVPTTLPTPRTLIHGTLHRSCTCPTHHLRSNCHCCNQALRAPSCTPGTRH
jgi:hypothetical protein